MIVKLERFADIDEQGTFGELTSNLFSFYTVERPWLDNEENISCIPAGTYTCKRVMSPKFGPVYEIMDVEDRTHILFHAANIMTDVKGCIGIGTRLGTIGQHWAVIQSRIAMTKFNNSLLDVDEFTLEVSWKHE